MRHWVCCTLASGLLAASLLIAGSESAWAGGGRGPATLSSVASQPGATHAVRPADMPVNPSTGGPAEGGGGELELLLQNPPWPAGVSGYIIFSTEGLQRTADDAQFGDTTPLVAVRVYYTDNSFLSDPNNPGTNFFLRIYEDDGTGMLPADPEIFASGPHNPLDGVLTVDSYETAGFGPDSILGATFNFNSEFFIMNAGVKYWFGMTCSPPSGTTQIGTAQSNTPFTSGQPMTQSVGGGAWASVDVNEPPGGPLVLIDMGMDLFGFAPTGGTSVFTMSGTTTNCTVRITPTTAPITNCDTGPCNTDPIFGPNCFASANVGAGLGPNEMAIALASSLQNNVGCDHNVINAVWPVDINQGPRVVITTTEGTKPKLCLSINGVAAGILGGTNDCEEDGCGLHFEVGPDDRLPTIGAGTDIFATPKEDCDLPLEDDAGTWAHVVAAGSLFNRPGLPPASGIDQRVRLSGVPSSFSQDDSDTSVLRIEDIRFDRCSGDFSRPGAPGQTFAPDGLVDDTDVAAFGPCNNTSEPFPGDCGFFDYDGNDTINQNDLFVLQCLAASGNSSECCPNNLDLPQNASSTIATEVTRLHLRGCEYLQVSRDGLICPENWVVDYYLSAQDPSVGADEVGECEAGDTEGVAGNNVIAHANSLGLLSEGDPRQVAGVIGNFEGCDVAPFWPGDMDADVYSFTLAFPSSVALRADGLNNVDCTCTFGQNGIVSLWLFDDRGILRAQSDSAGATDPAINTTLSPGEYFLMVAAAGQIAAPTADGIPGSPNCSIVQPPEVDGGGTDPTGCYDLHLAVAPSSRLGITQETLNGGSLSSRLLVQPLITYQRVCDPDAAVLVDTGDVGVDATVLEATGSWVNQLAAGSDVIAGDPDFIPGVHDDGGGSQSPELIQHADLLGNQAAHRVAPASDRKCETVFSHCAYSQAPDLNQTLGGVGSITSASQNFPMADDFSLAADADIVAVTFWVTPADIVGPDHLFTVRVLGNTAADPGEVCAGIPDESNVISEGTVGSPFVQPTTVADVEQVTVNLANPFTATAGTTYWLEITLESDVSPGAQTFFVTSLEGNGLFFHDVVPEAAGEGCTATANGDGYDCNNVPDDPETPDCIETDPDGDRRMEGDIAFCLGTQAAEDFTKTIPGDVACGSWRMAPGEIVWSQPFAVRADGTVGFFSDFSFGSAGGNQAADSFTFFETATITDVHWRGTYTVNTPDPAADDFTIEFWSGIELPAGLIQFYTPPNAQIERTPGVLSGDPGRQVFSYSFQLPPSPPFTVQANQTIWLSVINNTAGQDYNWTFAIGGGGNSDGRAALRVGLDNNPAWESLPDSGDPPTDFSFDITVAGNTKIVCGDSVDCTANGSVATGLGYRFDPALCVINGYQTKVGDPMSSGNRWRNVGAPWKMYQEVDGNDAPQSELPTLFSEIGGITQQEIDCLTENVPGNKTIAAVFAGLAAYDTDPETNGITVTGELQRLCNGGIIERVSPTAALSERVGVKGVCWTNGSATFLTQPTGPAPPQLVHGCGQPGETSPRSGLIDPRQESTNGTDLNLGYTKVRMVFDRPVFKCDGSDVDASSFQITETGGGTPPNIVSAVYVGGNATVDVTWDRPITLQEWTTVIAVDVCDGSGLAVLSVGNQGPGVDEPDRVDLGFLPCDVDQSSDVGPFDLLRFRQIINGVFIPCEPQAHLTDINRNLNVVDPFDLLTFRQLVNGISPPATRPWTGESMNNPQP